MSETTELIRATASDNELSIPQLVDKMEKVREAMKQAMKQDVDYGVIPGTKSKPTLLKPGAEKLCQMFRLSDEYDEAIIDLPGGHREYRVKCRLTHFPSQTFVGEASATCSTMESKYRYRGGARKCPMCGKEAIKKSKFPPRDQPQKQPGYYCFAKIGGCGANFDADDKDIVSQSEQKTENPDIADSYHNVQSIAYKRAYLAATRKATASSEMFTDSMEDAVVEGHQDDYAHRPQDAAAAKDQRRQAASGEESQVPPKAAPPPKEFIDLRDALYAMGVPAGNLEHANAVIRYAYEGATIQKCAKDGALSAKVHAGLIQRGSNGATSEQIYEAALKLAGLLVEAGAADETIPY